MAKQSNLNVSLTPRFVQMVRNHVASGRYQSASEVIREGLRLVEEREQRDADYWAAVRAKVAVAREQVDRGQTIDGPEFMNQLRQRVSPRSSRQQKAARRTKS